MHTFFANIIILKPSENDVSNNNIRRKMTFAQQHTRIQSYGAADDASHMFLFVYCFCRTKYAAPCLKRYLNLSLLNTTMRTSLVAIVIKIWQTVFASNLTYQRFLSVLQLFHFWMHTWLPDAKLAFIGKQSYFHVATLMRTSTNIIDRIDSHNIGSLNCILLRRTKWI